MAVPVVVSHAATDRPTDENTVGTDAQVAYRFTLVLTGTKANILADFNTVLATNFAAPSAVLSWDRAT